MSALHSLAQRCKRFSPLLALPAALLLIQGEAKAFLTYYISENAGNVEVQAVGSLLLPNPVMQSNCGAVPGGYVSSISGVICSGPGLGNMNYYRINGPTSFNGTVEIFPADSVSGIPTILFGGPSFYGIDLGYTPGTPITSTATFNSRTLAGLGFTTTGLLGTWTLQPKDGTDPYTANDTIQVVIGAPPSASVPGPLPLLGAGAAFGWARRLRKRTQLL
jgi:hypothetical protein